jgi:uracil-DNA glycosylase family 4
MESPDYHTARALLEWQMELGADECIADVPVDCYALPEKQARPDLAAAPKPHLTKGPVRLSTQDPVAVARAAAGAADTLEALRAALEAFDLCDFRLGARNMVFSDGTAGAPVMIVGDAPNRDDDKTGKPFSGQPGVLLDRMFGEIGMGRTRADAPLYLVTALPWRLPNDREPAPEEIAMMQPFLLRHIALADPEVLVLMGNCACQALLGKRGIARLRGTWTQAVEKPALPMCPPATLLRNPAAKREAWADLLMLKEAVDK